MKEIKDLFDKPKIIGIIGDVNSGKSMLLYNIIEYMLNEKNFKFYHSGLKAKVGGVKVFSALELEKLKNSFIVVDEFFTLFDLDDRKVKKNIEKTLRLIHHKNNFLILVGVGENFKKFISNKINIFIYKQITIGDMINGSRTKAIINSYTGEEKGSEVLNLEQNEALIFDGHYNLIKIPYLEKYDTKLQNKPIFTNKKNK